MRTRSCQLTHKQNEQWLLEALCIISLRQMPYIQHSTVEQVWLTMSKQLSRSMRHMCGAYLWQGGQPGDQQRLPAQLVGLQVHHATAAHCCRRGHRQIANLHGGDYMAASHFRNTMTTHAIEEALLNSFLEENPSTLYQIKQGTDAWPQVQLPVYLFTNWWSTHTQTDIQTRTHASTHQQHRYCMARAT